METATAIQQLWNLAKNHNHKEIWGVILADPEVHVPSQIVFQKYLNANEGDLAKAKDQMIKTLDWRAKVKPLELLNKSFSREKFEGMGFVTTYQSNQPNSTVETKDKKVFTWNVYGGVKDMEETFGDLDGYVNQTAYWKPTC